MSWLQRSRYCSSKEEQKPQKTKSGRLPWLVATNMAAAWRQDIRCIIQIGDEVGEYGSVGLDERYVYEQVICFGTDAS